MLRRTNATCWFLLLALVASGGCDFLTGVEDIGDARVEVDSRVVRTIHYYPGGPDGQQPPSEVTTKRLDEIDCLDAARGCYVGETVVATIHNTGARPLYWNDCDNPLRRYGLGEWHNVEVRICAGPALSEPPSIAPGEQRAFEVSVQGAPEGEYRVAFQLWDGKVVLPAEVGTSAAFHLEPLPDAPRFRCPSESRAELASAYAREALDDAAAGRLPSHLRQMLLLERQAPGFGGLYVDANLLYVWLTDLSQTDALSAAVRAIYGRNPLVRKADYSFSELLGWTRATSGLGILGVWSLNTDELTNRISIRIVNELIRADVECFVRGIGMPDGMARIARN